jgi:pyroglutamyl-peptidase
MQNKEIHLTGFGTFHGVSDNPSQILVEQYAQCSKEYGLSSTTVLEVSTEAVDKFLREMKQRILENISETQKRKIILLHLGVSASSKRYEIEKRGKNEASFRAPDQKNYQPMKQVINSNYPLDSWRYSSLPIEMITKRVNETLCNDGLHLPLSKFAPVSIIEATKNPLPFNMGEQELLQEEQQETVNDGLYLYESEDAGLFLCNYLYYTSLQTAEEINKEAGGKILVDSVFVHIPSHKTIPIEQQRTFVDAVLKNLDFD